MSWPCLSVPKDGAGTGFDWLETVLRGHDIAAYGGVTVLVS